MAEFRVIDLRSGLIEPEQTVDAKSPEDAGRQVLGIEVHRSGSPNTLVARVYWQAATEPMSMVRLYSKALYVRHETTV